MVPSPIDLSKLKSEFRNYQRELREQKLNMFSERGNFVSVYQTNSVEADASKINKKQNKKNKHKKVNSYVEKENAALKKLKDQELKNGF